MLPIRLEIRNFLPYRAPDPLLFEGIHLACLTGGNGAGKSSILDAITWALWGKSRAKRDDDLVHLGQVETSVQLDFEQEAVVFRVRRLRKRGKQTSGELYLFSRGEDNNWITLNEPSMKETQAKINRLLRLDYDTFVNSAYLQQGKADAFTTKTPAQRKQILTDILGLDQWAGYEEAVKAHLKTLEYQLYSGAERIREIDNDLAREPGLRVQLQETEAAHAEAERALKAAEARAEALKYSVGEHQAATDRVSDLTRNLKRYETEIKDAEGVIMRQTARIAGYQQIIDLREEIEAGYDALQAARNVDQALGEKLSQLKSLDEQRLEREGNLKAERVRLQGDIRQVEGRIADAARIIASTDSAELENLQVEVSALRALEVERDALTEQESSLREQRGIHETALKSLEETGKEQRERQEKLSAAEGATCPLCGQPLTDEHRRQLLEDLNVQIEAMRGAYRQAREQVASIGETLKQNAARTKKLASDLKRLPVLIEQVGNLRAQADAAHDAELRLQEDHAQLQDLQTALAAEAYGADIRAELVQIEAQIGALGYDSGSHQTARAELQTYRQFEQRRMELGLALEGLPDAQERLTEAENRKARYVAAQAVDTGQIEALAIEIARLAVLVEEYHQRSADANHYRTVEREAWERLNNTKQELNALANQREKKTQLLKLQDDLRYEEGLYKELREAFSKNGIPAMIIETAIPELEASANRLLSNLTDGRMHLKLNTQREKVTGGVAETLDIEISDELGTRNYEMYSGGEAFRIDFALRVALSQMLARRAGAHLRTLFIDEGFGSQDETGRNKLVEAITAIQNEFDMILVITHIEELRDNFPVHILVDKTANGSRIQVR